MSAENNNASCIMGKSSELTGSEPRIQHWDCEFYKDGVITDLEGHVMSPPETHGGFTR